MKKDFEFINELADAFSNKSIFNQGFNILKEMN